MKVLYFSDNISDHNRRFLEALSQAKHEIWFLDPTCDHLPENWLPGGVHWVQPRQRLQPGRTPSEFATFLPEFQNWLETIQPDLVHAGPTHNCGYVAALSNFHPWLLTSWGSDILYQADQEPEWKQATQRALSKADGLFVDCDAVRSQAKQWADIPDERIVQFPWGIKRGSFSPQGDWPSKDEFAPEPGTCVILSTRSWEPVYGIDILLEAFRRALRVDASLRLLLLGGGSEASRVGDFIDANGLRDAIRIPGHVSRGDAPKWFRAADVYVSCARSDGTSVSLLEAMATGLPVVVTDIPSNREWVTEDHNGWLASANSAEDFADKLLRAAGLSAERRALFTERNRQIVRERADWDRNFPKLLAMYDQLVAMISKG